MRIDFPGRPIFIQLPADGLVVAAHDDDDGDVVVALHGQVGPVVAAAVLRELAAAQGGGADSPATGAPASDAGNDHSWCL